MRQDKLHPYQECFWIYLSHMLCIGSWMFDIDNRHSHSLYTDWVSGMNNFEEKHRHGKKYYCKRNRNRFF
jgi:hypothetical protein